MLHVMLMVVALGAPGDCTTQLAVERGVEVPCAGVLWPPAMTRKALDLLVEEYEGLIAVKEKQHDHRVAALETKLKAEREGRRLDNEASDHKLAAMESLVAVAGDSCSGCGIGVAHFVAAGGGILVGAIGAILLASAL